MTVSALLNAGGFRYADCKDWKGLSTHDSLFGARGFHFSAFYLCVTLHVTNKLALNAVLLRQRERKENSVKRNIHS